jgi:hypothetical protein
MMFDGLNDFLWGLNGLFNTIFEIVIVRLQPIVENQIELIAPLINDLLLLIPESIPIPGTLLSLELGFAHPPIVKEAISL